MRIGSLVIMVLSALLGAEVAIAQSASDYPNRTVRLILPGPAGSPTDSGARVLATGLTSRWSQPVIVENRPGAGGQLAYEAVARATPDGYTLVVTASALTTFPYITANLKFNPERDFVPISQLIRNVAVLAINPTIPAKNLSEFLEWTKANKGKVNYGSPGRGTIVQMTIELINAQAGTDMTEVPFAGVPQYTQAFLRGDVQLIYTTYTQAAPLHESGKAKIIAVVGDERLPELPGVPSLKESGYFNYVPTSWNGLSAPAGTPKEIVDKIAADTIAVLKLPDSAAQIRKATGAQIVASTPEQHRQMIQAEFKLWGDMAKRLGLQPQ